MNRYESENIGRLKVDVAKERIKNLLKIVTVSVKLNEVKQAVIL